MTSADEYATYTEATLSNFDFVCKWVTSKADCEEAAQQLGLADTEAEEESDYRYPPYCYIYDGKQLYFNKKRVASSEKNMQCNYTNNCICKKD